MQRNIVVELAHLLRKDGAGVSRKRLLSGLGRLKEVHELLRKGQEEGGWPHLVLPDAEAVSQAVEVARGLGDRLVVVGQPGGITALRALVDALGTRAPVWVTSPDNAWLEALDAPGVGWLVLEGPPWADRVAEWAVGNDRAVAVAGPGVHEAPPGGWWVSDAVAGDGRFGCLGAAALVCAAWSGIDVVALVEGAREMLAACARPALLENPAYTLALAAHFTEKDLGLATPVHLATTGRLAGFTAWLCRMWGAVGADTTAVGGVVQHAGAAGVGGIVGDEELTQVLLVGPRDKVVVLWDPVARPDGPVPAEESSQGAVFQDLWDRENLPSLRVRLPALDAPTLGAAVVLAQHAAVTASLYAGLDPLGLGGVAAWYAALGRARDVDGGAPSA